jgi:hypothetical protein
MVRQFREQTEPCQELETLPQSSSLSAILQGAIWLGPLPRKPIWLSVRNAFTIYTHHFPVARLSPTATLGMDNLIVPEGRDCMAWSRLFNRCAACRLQAIIIP